VGWGGGRGFGGLWRCWRGEEGGSGKVELKEKRSLEGRGGRREGEKREGGGY